jgi:hypothetical protein
MLHRSKLYAAGLLAAVFAAGVAVGTGVSAAASDRRDDTQDRRTPERLSYAERLERELALNPVQRDSVDRILTAYEDSMSAMWTELRPRMDALRTSIRQNVTDLLDSTQLESYRAYMHRTDSIRAARDAARDEGGRHGRR